MERKLLPVLFSILILSIGLIGFSPYATAQEETTLPDWFENNHTWLDNKQIDDELFLQAMQYLIDNDLIKTQKDSMTHKFASSTNNVISNNNLEGAEHFVHFAADSNVSGCENTNSCLVPYTITINVGDSVTWYTEYRNTISAGDLSVDPNLVGLNYPNGFDSGFMQMDTTFTHQFDTEGTYPYFSMIRPWASGVVIVTTVEEQIDDLKDQVNGFLDGKDAKKLTKKLDKVNKELGKDKLDKACKELGKFNKDANKIIDQDKIPSIDGEGLIDSVYNIKSELDCPFVLEQIAIQSIINDIRDLTDGELKSKDSKKLLKKLDKILKEFEKDEIDKNCKELDKFIKEVNKLVEKEKLAQSDADKLISLAQDIQSSIVCS